MIRYTTQSSLPPRTIRTFPYLPQKKGSSAFSQDPKNQPQGMSETAHADEKEEQQHSDFSGKNQSWDISNKE
jgi:hypothetical protein